MPTTRFLNSSASTNSNPTAGPKVDPRRKLVLAEQGVLEEGAMLIPKFDVNRLQLCAITNWEEHHCSNSNLFLYTTPCNDAKKLKSWFDCNNISVGRTRGF